MEQPSKPALHWRGNAVSRRSVLVGVGAVAAFLAVDLGAVAYANHWIGRAGALTRHSFLSAFRAAFGNHPGFRANHAKGVAVTGFFDSSGALQDLSTAPMFVTGRTAVTGRFSLGGGNPFAPDTADNVRGLGLAFAFPDGSQWRTAMVNLPVFPDNSPQGFYDRFRASQPVATTGKPDPLAMKVFLSAHPETAAAMAIIKKAPPTHGFADATFRGLNTFYLVDNAGNRTPVRWAFVPQQPAGAPGSGGNALFDALIRQLRAGPLHWKLQFTVGDPADPTDPTLPWPVERKSVDAGTLTLTTAETDTPGNARDISFDPLILPTGIVASDDPLLSARSAVYAGSYRDRAGATGAAPAVQVNRV
jgi:catalase